MSSRTFHWTVADWLTHTMQQIEALDPAAEVEAIAALEAKFFAFASGEKSPALWQSQPPPPLEPEKLRRFTAARLLASSRASA